MDYFQAIILSLVQGISEFLPISSKGHLNLAQHLLGLQSSLTFDIFLNTATLLSVIFFFRSQIPYFIKNLKYIIVGTLPAIFFGFILKHRLESLFSNPHILPYLFLVTAALLFATKYLKPKTNELTYKRALIIGLIQSAALFPGISRSGSTIFGGLLMGLSSIAAFNFSFALFIPASIGALVLDLKDMLSIGAYWSPVYAFSFVLTALVGYFALSFLKKVLIGQKFWYFSLYLVFLSVFCFFWL
jgi:undecaprenyl-diphosphatase